MQESMPLVVMLSSLLFGLVIKILWDTKGEIVELRKTVSKMLNLFAPRIETNNDINRLSDKFSDCDKRLTVLEEFKKSIDT